MFSSEMKIKFQKDVSRGVVAFPVSWMDFGYFEDGLRMTGGVTPKCVFEEPTSAPLVRKSFPR